MIYNLERFKIAQADCYNRVLQEMQVGKKSSHWMWYIFPQIKGLGKTARSRKYAIQNADEAKAFLMDELLSERYIQLTEILYHGDFGSAQNIFGYPDWMKFRSSLTLFHLTIKDNAAFHLENRFDTINLCLEKYFNGVLDEYTINILEK